MRNRIPFGPVPSRRLNLSLGINHIPPKICTYSCIYCQVGKTLRLTNKRQSFYNPEEIRIQIVRKVKELKEKGERIDYLSFVPDGEPTLDINLGKEIELLKDLCIPIAVITNGTFLTHPLVREELGKADWVSLKIDSVTKRFWKRIDRPHTEIVLANLLSGMIEFSESYRGALNTETMFIEGINDDVEEMKRIADFIKQLKVEKAYIAIPTRPPLCKWIRPPHEEVINTAYNIFSERIEKVEILIGYADDDFAGCENVRNDILDITAVHPMTEDDVRKMLKRSGKDWEVVSRMIEDREIIDTKYGGKRFFIRAHAGRKR